MTDAADHSSTRFFNDSVSALRRQFAIIFRNLGNAPDNCPWRMNQCLSDLLDFLVVHAKEISELGLVNDLFRLVQNTFGVSIQKGIQVLRVVFDVQIGDQHEERTLCLELLMRQAADAASEKDCTAMLHELGEVLQENVRSTSDMLAKNLSQAINMMRQGVSLKERAVGCQILATMVGTSSGVIKRNPTLLDTLTTSYPLCLLFREIIYSSDGWHRHALVSLLLNVVENHCVDVTPAVSEQMANTMRELLEKSHELGCVVGVFTAIESIATSPILQTVLWPLEEIYLFLTTGDWRAFSTEVCVMAPRTTGKALSLFTKNEELYDGLVKHLLLYISEWEEAVAVGALTTFHEIVKSLNITLYAEMTVKAICSFIARFSFHQLAFDTLHCIWEWCGDQCVDSIYKLVDVIGLDTTCANLQKLGCLLRLMGDRAPFCLTQYKHLPIDISAHLPVDALVSALSVLVTLGRTDKMGEAVELMFHERLEVRRAAVDVVAVFCETLILSAGGDENTDQMTHRLDITVTDAVGKLLDVAVADQNEDLRYNVLCRLSPAFDPYLSLPDHLEALVMARNDVSLRARERTLILLCRLHPCHPGIVHSQLLPLQEYMLCEIEAKDGSVSAAIYQASLLKMIAEHDMLLLQPKMVEMSLLERLQKQLFVSKKFSIVLLSLLQAVLDHTGPQNHCSAKQLLQPVIQIINGSTSSKRRKAALETLCSILTTITITESSTYMDVYRALGRIIRLEAEEDVAVNYAATKALSVIGAANPIKIRHILKALEEDEIGEAQEVVTSVLVHYKPRMRIHPHITDHYPSIVHHFLVRTLHQCADPEKQASTILTVCAMIREIPDNQKALLLTRFFPQLQAWLADPEKACLYEGILLLMTELATLLRTCKETIPPHTGSELLHSVRLFCLLPQASQKPFNAHVVELLDELARELPAQEMRDHRWAVDFIHQRLSQDKSDLDLVLSAVKSLESFLVVLQEKDLQVVLPHVLQCIEPVDLAPADAKSSRKEINTACFDFLNQVMVKQSALVKNCCAEIVHTITRHIENSGSRGEMEMGFSTLAVLVDVVGRQARRFNLPIERLAAQKGFSESWFADLLQSAAKGVLRARIPTGKRDKFKPDLPLNVTSHLPMLSRGDFEDEMMRVLRFGPSEFEVMDVGHPNGQTVIKVHFFERGDMGGNFRTFTRNAQETQSRLRRSLGILKLDQNQVNAFQVDESLLQRIDAVPFANKKKREQSWVGWLHRTSVSILKNSPISSLRCTATLAEKNTDLSRDLFLFAAAALIAQLDKAQRESIMLTLTRAVQMSPNDIKQVLFGFAEFFESERGKTETILEKRMERVHCVVERESIDQKFGINYDQHPRGIVVAKLDSSGPGAKAGVKVGAFLVSINGHKLSRVNEIVPLIRGLERIDLVFDCEIEKQRQLESKPLMDLDVLARVAFDSQMHAKAIFFNEVLFDQLFSELGDQVSGRENAAVRRALGVAERLIEFYGHLGLNMVAKGLVKKISAKFSENIIAPEQFGFDEVGVLEQLNWWAEALSRYQSRLTNADGSLDTTSFLGALRCHDALGDTIIMEERISAEWARLDSRTQLEVAPLKAKAALSLGKWQQFDELVDQSGILERLGMVERCAALFRQRRYQELLHFTTEQRESFFDSFSESFMESYNRSYDTLVALQHLRHFEELVWFVHSGDERRQILRNLWQKRLIHMSSRPAHIKTLITINSLVLSPKDDLASHVICVGVLSKFQWTSLANHMLNLLLGSNKESHVLCTQDPDVIHAYMKHCYTTESKPETFNLLSDILARVQVSPGDSRAEAWGCCWLLLGEWTMHLFPEKGEEAIEKVKRATDLSPKNHAAFHSLGILHYDMSRDSSTPVEVQTRHYVDSITALFKSVELSRNQSNGVMEDVLRILSIWFSHSTIPEINEAVKEGVNTVPDYVWLKVIPQLVARIGITAKLAKITLRDLLVRVGTKYPHALIYPLTVTEKSPEAIRQLTAQRVLEAIRVSNGPMVEEASLISNEMVRIAILWAEKWYSHIQQAAEKHEDANAILRILSPLYDELENASTANESSFEKMFGQTLRRARSALQNADLGEAWPLLKQVYAQLSKTTGERRLHMEDLSPTLGSINSTNVAVPGTFVLGQPLITISRFRNRVTVMPSKQKPRRFGLDASNGEKYRFLLKGHEDLRQDERVMQFIELINTIFSFDSSSSAIGLTIPQYAVIPLTDNVGIIGWVENTETIYRMLEARRREHKISVHQEIHMILKSGDLRNVDEYHRQSKQQRKNLLSHVMNNTPDDELRRIIWDKNDTCEQWLQYRGTYGHTLAIMSIVGYVLGLGDRHLNNLMLQDKGSVVHIDFGDCFEVAMHRLSYAEAVPFRLTRLLVRALGITGVDGVYRLTCELVMKNLRRHCENLLSILEAFIYDPLINWRLTNVGEGEHSSSCGEATGLPAYGGLLDTVETITREPPMQLSFTVLKMRDLMGALTVDQLNEEETRNMQGDKALARVRAKLTGEDFEIVNNSFLMQSSRRDAEDSDAASSWGSQSYTDLQKDSFGMGNTVLTTFLSLQAVNGGARCLDVPHQVDRLIQEATSLDNLAEAYLTGWAPFW